MLYRFSVVSSVDTIVLMPPNQQNQYDFITSPSQNMSTGPAFLQNPKQRNIVVVVFVLVVITLVIVGFSIITSIGKGGNDSIIDTAAYQTELLRISSLGYEGATDPSVKTQLSTLQAFIGSDLANTTSYLATNGAKLSEKQSLKYYDLTVEQALEEATISNKFDEEIITIINQLSDSYKESLQKSLGGTSSETGTTVIQTAAENIIIYEGT